MSENIAARFVAACFLLAGLLLICQPAIGLDGEVPDPPAADSVEPPLTFESECIQLTVGADSLEVEGLYRFACQPTDAKFTALLYPFPRDSLLGISRMVSLAGRSRGGGWQPLSFKELYPQGSGVLWRIPLGEDPLYEVRAIYRQALVANYGRYIVSTTRTWQSPLKKARFEIALPEGAIPTYFSFPFECIEFKGEDLYVFEAEDFLPDQDIVFKWVH